MAKSGHVGAILRPLLQLRLFHDSPTARLRILICCFRRAVGMELRFWRSWKTYFEVSGRGAREGPREGACFGVLRLVFLFVPPPWHGSHNTFLAPSLPFPSSLFLHQFVTHILLVFLLLISMLGIIVTLHYTTQHVSLAPLEGGG